MQFRANSTTASGGRELWPLLVLLLLAVIVPTACLLWFMTEAANNERMAVRQKLTELYQVELADTQKALRDFWKDKAIALDRFGGLTLTQQFAAIVTNGLAESAIIFDAAGKLAYPAATIFSANAKPSTNDATILQAEVQALAKTGNVLKALSVVEEKLADEKLQNATDDGGRLTMAYVQLFVLETATNRGDSSYQRIQDALLKRVADYSQPIPSPQRLFLMKRLVELDSRLLFPTLQAEQLAAPFADTAGHSNELWQIASTSRTVVALFSRPRALAEMQTVVDRRPRPTGASVRIERVSSHEAEEPFLSLPAGDNLPDWNLNLYLDRPNPFAAAAEKQVAVYLWTALLVITLIAAVAGLMGRHLLRQLRLNRLKNDFVATISHELKTPLASMRVLVDTLIDGRQADTGQAAEYLQLISKENERLSRLIDNFLTFSRMERNKRSFNFVEMNPDTVARAALDAVRERFEIAGAKLEIASSPDLPPIIADKDALVTVLINLMDNAFKYSEKEKRIALRASVAGGEVRFDVEDNGIGISRRDMKRIWDRFYQVDQSLARRASGCGLGLSIVKFIVEAHGGRVDVKSQLGQGSTFSVIIPMADKAKPAER